MSKRESIKYLKLQYPMMRFLLTSVILCEELLQVINMPRLFANIYWKKKTANCLCTVQIAQENAF